MLSLPIPSIISLPSFCFKEVFHLVELLKDSVPLFIRKDTHFIDPRSIRCLKDFISQLPEGYMTRIGEHGTSLSGGERQRIAIARALYKEPEILIFDEATSALDLPSEQYVKKALLTLAEKGKTIVLIAHRLTTVRGADQIVVLDQGKVVGIGTHAQLCENSTLYRDLWNEVFTGLE